MCRTPFYVLPDFDGDARAVDLTNEAITKTITNFVSSKRATMYTTDTNLEGATNAVQYKPDAASPHYVCAAPSTNQTTVQALPYFLVLARNHRQGERPILQHRPWVEQPPYVDIEAPMEHGTTITMRYKLIAIIQHKPGHWTVSFNDHRNDTWYYHDGMKNGGRPIRCNSQAESIQESADGFQIVYVKL